MFNATQTPRRSRRSSSGSNSVLDGTREESLGNVMRSYEGEPVGGDSGSDPEGDDSGSGSPLGTGSPNSPEGARSGDFDSATVPEVGEREEGVGENSDTEPETHEVVLSTSTRYQRRQNRSCNEFVEEIKT